jgi:hypothetical protein
MASSYEQAVAELYRAPHESFVAERQRLARELKAEGDKLGAARLGKLPRPTISAWAVNQLWWHARDAFDELFDTAALLRSGNLAASPAHRKAIASLGARAQRLLSESGHSANDATLRRVAMTLSGLAAAGTFEPDTPGALGKDRDPPGFEAFGIESSSNAHTEDGPTARQKSASGAPTPAAKNDGKPHGIVGSAAVERRAAGDAKRQRDAEAAERKREAEASAAERKREADAAVAQRIREAEAAAAERKREAEAQAKRHALRKQLEGELKQAKAVLAEREHDRDRIEKQLATAEREVQRARSEVDAAQAKLDLCS